MAELFLIWGRKQDGYDLPPGWTETHWERFDYIECGRYSKPDGELTDEDREWVRRHREPPEGWISPMSWAEADAMRKRISL